MAARKNGAGGNGAKLNDVPKRRKVGRPKKFAGGKQRGSWLSLEQISDILVETLHAKDQDVADKHGISVTSVVRYRRLSAENPELAELVESKTRQIRSEWVENAIHTLNVGLEKLRELFTTAEQKQMRDVAGAVHLLSEHINAASLVGTSKSKRDKQHGGRVCADQAAQPVAEGSEAGEQRPAEPGNAAAATNLPKLRALAGGTQ
jgi:hypothetical protein